MKKNPWKIATIILFLVFIGLLIATIANQREIDFGYFKIKETQLDNFFRTLDSDKIFLCNFDERVCGWIVDTRD